MEPIDANGHVAFHLHFATDGCSADAIGDCRWLDLGDLVEVGGRAKGQLADDVSFRVDSTLRLRNALAVDEVDETQDGLAIQPLVLDVNEASIRLQDLIGPIGVTVGQQRFAWGTTAGISPLDVLNPYDLRDPTHFDRRLGVPAISALVESHGVGFEVAWLPLFRPARLPAGTELLAGGDELFDFGDVGGESLQLGELETRTEVPDTRIGFAGVGGRLTIALSFVDLSVVGFHGLDTLPQLDGTARIVGYSGGSDLVDVGLPVTWPVTNVGGLGARGELFADLVASGEIAVVIPEHTEVTASRAQLDALVDLGLIDEVPDPLPTTVTQDGKPLVRAVVSLDRTFGRFVLIGTFVRGLPTERQGSEIRNYGGLAAIVTVSDPVQIRAQGLTDAQGWLVSGEFAVLHRDTATITLGATIADGPEDSALGRLRSASRVSAGVEIAF